MKRFTKVNKNDIILFSEIQTDLGYRDLEEYEKKLIKKYQNKGKIFYLGKCIIEKQLFIVYVDKTIEIIKGKII